MSGSDRVCALVGLTLLAASAYAQPVGRNGGGQSSAQQPQAVIAPNPNPTLPPAVQNDIERIARALEAANAHPEAAAEQKRAQDDLQAQKDMASWAFWMMVVGGIEAAITAAGVVLVYGTLIYTRRAAEAARDAVVEAQEATNAANKTIEQTERHARQQLRAYLAFTKGNVDVAARLVKFQIRNCGATPAHGVRVKARVFFGDYPEVDILQADDSYAQTFFVGANSRVRWRVSFPGDFGADEQSTYSPGSDKSLYLLVRIDYVDVFQQAQWLTVKALIGGPAFGGVGPWHPYPCQDGNESS